MIETKKELEDRLVVLNDKHVMFEKKIKQYTELRNGVKETIKEVKKVLSKL